MAEPASLGAAVAAARVRLGEASDTPELDARLLAEAAFGLDFTQLVLRSAEMPDRHALGRFDAFLDRRAAGEPVHRILGRRAFYAHTFELSPETLEPRPDTEILVDLAASAIRARGKPDILFADIGTGTGAIGISLLALFPQATCIAVDIAPGALVTARRNAAAAGVGSRFWPVAGDYLEGLGAPLDMIVSNPPYIETSRIAGLPADVRDHDPILALDGGEDGLEAYRAIAGHLIRHSGWVRDVLFEIGSRQLGDVRAIFNEAGYDLADTAKDLAGHDRALWFRKDSWSEAAENERSCGNSDRKRL